MRNSEYLYEKTIAQLRRSSMNQKITQACRSEKSGIFFKGSKFNLLNNYKKLLTLILVSLCVCSFSDELLRNGNFDNSVHTDFFGSWLEGHIKASQFVEDLTWNKCLKLEIKNVPDGTVSGNAIFGKKDKLIGIPVKPDTLYTFSFEAKGTVPSFLARASLFYDEGDWQENLKIIQSSLGSAKLTGEWTRYEGTFLTDANTKRAALFITLWGDAKQQKDFSWEPGQFLLIDNISLKEKSSPLAIGAETKLELVPVLFAPSLANKLEGELPFSIKLGKEMIAVTVELPLGTPKTVVKTNGIEIWKDDVAELFFGPLKSDRVLSQFCIASGGGRYMGNGQIELKNYDSWIGKVEDRTFTFKIPYKLLGYEEPPVDGMEIAFNLGVQAGGKVYSLPPVKGKFHDVTRYNLLIFGTLDDYLKRNCPPNEIANLTRLAPGEAIGKMRQLKKQLALEKLGKMPFLLLRYPVTNGFSLPLDFSEKNLVIEPIELRAAINEHKALPVAIINRTAKPETYRVVIHPNLGQSTVDFTGLTNNFPSGNITMREALRVKDSDASGAGSIFDPLPLMNQAQTITIAPGETGLIWLEFNCKNVEPGKYFGAIRVIPLQEIAIVTRDKYKGEMRDYPLKLEVLPITLQPLTANGTWCNHNSENSFTCYQALSPGPIMIDPWSIPFRFDEKGNVINQLPELVKSLHNEYILFKKHNINSALKFIIGYSTYSIMVRAHLNKKINHDSPECYTAWRNYLKSIAELMKEAGINESEYGFELFDEPHGENFTRDLKVCRIAKETLPNANFYMTWAPHNYGYTPEMIRKFIPYVNHHLFHHLLLLDPTYMKVVEEVKSNPQTHYGFYSCSTSMRESLHRYYRLIGWKGFRTEAETYHVYIFCESPWGELGATNWKAAAEGGLTLRSGNDQIPTIRYEALREGFTDIQYMEALARKHKDPATQKFIHDATERVVVNNAHDSVEPDRVRAEIVKLLTKH